MPTPDYGDWANVQANLAQQQQSQEQQQSVATTPYEQVAGEILAGGPTSGTYTVPTTGGYTPPSAPSFTAPTPPPSSSGVLSSVKSFLSSFGPAPPPPPPGPSPAVAAKMYQEMIQKDAAALASQTDINLKQQLGGWLPSTSKPVSTAVPIYDVPLQYKLDKEGEFVSGAYPLYGYTDPETQVTGELGPEEALAVQEFEMTTPKGTPEELTQFELDARGGFYGERLTALEKDEMVVFRPPTLGEEPTIVAAIPPAKPEPPSLLTDEYYTYKPTFLGRTQLAQMFGVDYLRLKEKVKGLPTTTGALYGITTTALGRDILKPVKDVTRGAGIVADYILSWTIPAAEEGREIMRQADIQWTEGGPIAKTASKLRWAGGGTAALFLPETRLGVAATAVTLWGGALFKYTKRGKKYFTNLMKKEIALAQGIDEAAVTAKQIKAYLKAQKTGMKFEYKYSRFGAVTGKIPRSVVGKGLTVSALTPPVRALGFVEQKVTEIGARTLMGAGIGEGAATQAAKGLVTTAWTVAEVAGVTHGVTGMAKAEGPGQWWASAGETALWGVGLAPKVIKAKAGLETIPAWLRSGAVTTKIEDVFLPGTPMSGFGGFFKTKAEAEAAARGLGTKSEIKVAADAALKDLPKLKSVKNKKLPKGMTNDQLELLELGARHDAIVVGGLSREATLGTKFYIGDLDITAGASFIKAAKNLGFQVTPGYKKGIFRIKARSGKGDFIADVSTFAQSEGGVLAQEVRRYGINKATFSVGLPSGKGIKMITARGLLRSKLIQLSKQQFPRSIPKILKHVEMMTLDPFWQKQLGKLIDVNKNYWAVLKPVKAEVGRFGEKFARETWKVPFKTITETKFLRRVPSKAVQTRFQKVEFFFRGRKPGQFLKFGDAPPKPIIFAERYVRKYPIAVQAEMARQLNVFLSGAKDIKWTKAKIGGKTVKYFEIQPGPRGAKGTPGEVWFAPPPLPKGSEFARVSKSFFLGGRTDKILPYYRYEVPTSWKDLFGGGKSEILRLETTAADLPALKKMRKTDVYDPDFALQRAADVERRAAAGKTPEIYPLGRGSGELEATIQRPVDYPTFIVTDVPAKGIKVKGSLLPTPITDIKLMSKQQLDLYLAGGKPVKPLKVVDVKVQKIEPMKFDREKPITELMEEAKLKKPKKVPKSKVKVPKKQPAEFWQPEGVPGYKPPTKAVLPIRYTTPPPKPKSKLKPGVKPKSELTRYTRYQARAPRTSLYTDFLDYVPPFKSYGTGPAYQPPRYKPGAYHRAGYKAPTYKTPDYISPGAYELPRTPSIYKPTPYKTPDYVTGNGYRGGEGYRVDYPIYRNGHTPKYPGPRTDRGYPKPFRYLYPSRSLTPKKRKAKLKELFQPFVRKRGVWMRIGDPQPKGKALRAGAAEVKRTLAASFKIRAAGRKAEVKDVPFIVSPLVFRKPKTRQYEQERFTFIQRGGAETTFIKSARLASPGERRQIQLLRRPTTAPLGGAWADYKPSIQTY